MKILKLGVNRNMKYISIFVLFLGVSLEAMTLQETIDYALEHNNALKQSDVSIQRAKEVRDSKAADKFGRVDLTASYDHFNNSRTLAPLTPMSIVGSPDGAYTIPTTKDLFSVGVSYNVSLFDGFAQKSDYAISDLQYLSSHIKTKLAKEELIYNVRSLYISILSLEEQLKAQQIYTKAQTRLLENIKKERELGSKSKLDVLKAQNSVEESKMQEVSIAANIDIIKASLSAIMGDREFDKAEGISISIDHADDVEVDDKDITSLDRFKASELNVKANAKKREKLKGMYYPRVDFMAYYGQNFGPNDTTNTVPLTSTAPTAGQTIINEGDWNNEAIWQVGIHLKWNILDFGKTSALNQEARLSYMKAKLESDGVKIEMRKSIIKAKNEIRLSMAQYNNLLSQYNLLEETYKIEKVRYDNDALSLSDLLDTSAKKKLIYAKVINAKYNYQKAKYYLDYLLETGEK